MAKSRNLTPGLVGKGKPIVLGIDASGLEIYSIAWGARINRMTEAIAQRHRRKFRDLYHWMQVYFDASILRPAERGLRAGGTGSVSKRRMTGRFTIGPTGNIRPTLLAPRKGKSYSGFGVPDIELADAGTGGIWRVLEWGLGPKRANSTFGSIGPHVLPRLYTFRPWQPRRAGQLIILRKKPIHTLRGDRYPERYIQDRVGQGVPPKHFIEKAFAQVTRNLPHEYRRVITNALTQPVRGRRGG